MTAPRDHHRGPSRRSVLAGAFAALGWSAFDRAEAQAQDAPAVRPRSRRASG